MAASSTVMAESRAVNRYIEQLNRPRRPGRKPTPEKVEQQLNQVRTALANGCTPVERVTLVQKRIDLEVMLDDLRPTEDNSAAEGFIAVARSFTERKGISWRAWREVGVPAAVLRQAGLTPQ